MANKVLFLAQYFYPEVTSTAQLLIELAAELHKRDMEVSAFVGQPSYVKSKKIAREEEHQGVYIRRLFATRFDKNKSFSRIANSLTFFLSSLLHVLFSHRDRILFIASNPPFLVLIGWLLKKIRRQRYLCLVQDIYPDIAVTLGYLSKGGFIVKMWDKLNSKIYRDADAVIVLGEYMKEVIAAKLEGTHAKGENIHVVHNWADGDFIKPLAKEENWFCKEHDLLGKQIILYSGNLGSFHDLETIIDAAEQLQEIDDLLFLFIGEGGKKKKLVEMAQEKGLRNVQFLTYQLREYLPFSLTCGDISVVTVERGVEGLAVPCKLYSSLAAGQAILGLIGENSEVATIIREYNCGIRVDQGDAEGVVEALKELHDNAHRLERMKKNARRCFEENFTKGRAMNEYRKIITGIR